MNIRASKQTNNIQYHLNFDSWGVIGVGGGVGGGVGIILGSNYILM